MKSKLIKTIGAIGISSVFLFGCTSAEFEENVKKGEKAMESEKYKEAVEAFSAAIKENPDDKEVKESLKKAEEQLELQKNGHHPKLEAFVTTLKFNPAQFETYNVNLIGAEFGKNISGYGFKDSDVVSDLLGVLDTSINESSSDETMKRDGKLFLYFEIKANDKASPRNLERLDFPVSVVDDQGEKGIELGNDLSEKYPEIDKPVYGTIGYSVYSDSKNFKVTIGNETYELKDIPFDKK